jgi:FG-GAP repeat
VSQWLETQKLVNPAGSGTDRFGWSVAMHTTVGPMPDYIAVGAPGELQEAGSVHVYMYSSSSGGVSQWNLLQTLTSQLYSSGPDQFGSALAVDGDTLVISAVGAAAGSGAVDIWSLSVGGTIQYIFTEIVYYTSALRCCARRSVSLLLASKSEEIQDQHSPIA